MRLALFLAFLLFFAAAFAWRTWRRYGVNLLLLPRDEARRAWSRADSV